MEFNGIDAFGWIIITVGFGSILSPVWQWLGARRNFDND